MPHNKRPLLGTAVGVAAVLSGSPTFIIVRMLKHHGAFQQVLCRSPFFLGMAALAAYYKQMASLETRFPIDDERGVKMAFCWQDAFKPRKKGPQYSVAFERASILFNLAALESQAGMGQDRTQPAG